MDIVIKRVVNDTEITVCGNDYKEVTKSFTKIINKLYPPMVIETREWYSTND